MVKIAIISLITLFLSSFIKRSNPEISSLINVCGGVIIFSLVTSELQNIISFFASIHEVAGFDFGFIEHLLKIIGVGYIAEFAIDLANDFGNSVIASKLIFGGKVVICGMALPVIKDLLSLLFSFL